MREILCMSRHVRVGQLRMKCRTLLPSFARIEKAEPSTVICASLTFASCITRLHDVQGTLSSYGLPVSNGKTCCTWVRLLPKIRNLCIRSDGRLGMSSLQAAGRRVAYHTFSHVLDLDLAFHLERRTGTLTRILERGILLCNFLFTLHLACLILGAWVMLSDIEHLSISWVCSGSSQAGHLKSSLSQLAVEQELGT